MSEVTLESITEQNDRILDELVAMRADIAAIRTNMEQISDTLARAILRLERLERRR